MSGIDSRQGKVVDSRWGFSCRRVATCLRVEAEMAARELQDRRLCLPGKRGCKKSPSAWNLKSRRDITRL
jgi:hypothetical protein